MFLDETLEKTLNTWLSSHTFLNRPWVKEETKVEIIILN